MRQTKRFVQCFAVGSPLHRFSKISRGYVWTPQRWRVWMYGKGYWGMRSKSFSIKEAEPLPMVAKSTLVVFVLTLGTRLLRQTIQQADGKRFSCIACTKFAPVQIQTQILLLRPIRRALRKLINHLTWDPLHAAEDCLTHAAPLPRPSILAV